MRSLKEALIRKNRNVEQILFDAEHSENIINFLTSNYNIKKNDIEIKFDISNFLF